MRKINLATLLLYLFTLSGKSFAQDSLSVNVTVEGFQNSKGICRLLLFENEEGFPDLRQFAILMSNQGIQNKTAEFNLKIKPGKYAVAVLHDENSNGKMDKNWLGIPSEGFGASNNPKIGFGPPEFDESAINLDKNNAKVKIKLNYM